MKNTRLKPALLSLSLSCAALTSTAQAAQVATDPGDYAPLPAGIDLGILYLQSFENDEFYVNGQQVENGPTLSADIGLLRCVHYIELGGFIIDPQVILPFGQLKLNAGGAEIEASGIGDPILGATIWLYNNPDTKQAVGVTGLVSVPLGSYDTEKGPVNLGENRTKFITQAAFITPISEQFSLHLVGEYTFFGDNDDFGASGITRKQDDQYGYQVHLNYHISDTTTASVNYYHDFGAESQVSEVEQQDELNNNRWQVTLQHFLQPDLQVQAQYGRSISVENGFFETDRINLRFVKVF